MTERLYPVALCAVRPAKKSRVGESSLSRNRAIYAIVRVGFDLELALLILNVELLQESEAEARSEGLAHGNVLSWTVVSMSAHYTMTTLPGSVV